MVRRPSLPESRRAGRRAARVTAAAAAGFYPALYLLDQPVMAIYALFAPISFGVLSPVPGSGRRRALTLLRALPAAAALTALGTALAVATWPAVAGMVFVGFALTFLAACGPRLAGTVPGLQLFYILACFPPYAPDTLPQRLIGLTAGTLLLALGEVLLFPEPAEPSYRVRLADALDLAAHAAGSFAGAGRSKGTDVGLAARLKATGRSLRFSQQPPGARPTGAGHTDRALAQAGSATRRLLDLLAGLAGLAPDPADSASRDLLRGIASTCAATADALRGARPLAGPELIEEMTAQFLAARGAAPDARAAPSRALLLRQSTVLTSAVSAVTVRAAALLALGGPRPLFGLPRAQFWYAATPAVRLWALRILGNVTPRSVVFQNAVRTALGLGLARLVAGSLELTHGFWVLLAVLTLGRTTAGATWSVVRSAVAGTLVGALAAGVLLVGAGDATDVYAALLAPVMLLAFTVGPLGGPAWAQGLFTLVVSTAFAQLAPVTWRLAEARIVDVLTGSAVGLLCGVLAWPSGARAEIRRSVAALFRSTAPLVRATVAAAAGEGGVPGPRHGDTAEEVRTAQRRLRIAEAVYAQYRTEFSPRPAGEGPDWLAALNFGSRVLVGAHWLPRTDSMRDLPPAALRWLRAATDEVEAAALRAAGFPADGLHISLPPLPPDVAARTSWSVLPLLTDMEVWFEALTTDLEATTDHRPTPTTGRPARARERWHTRQRT
ncbi:FUSC family protein [Streptomyces sp. NPDC002553]|uniref:FUSC family protein n=1 Tax=unclassified Streptomyces TaxID=2593676 RepID=UPI00331A369F